MVLLKFHFSFSVLCMLTIFGFWVIFKKAVFTNGWGGKAEGGAFRRLLYRARNYLYFALLSFVPIVNVLMPWIIYYLATHKPPEEEAP